MDEDHLKILKLLQFLFNLYTPLYKLTMLNVYTNEYTIKGENVLIKVFPAKQIRKGTAHNPKWFPTVPLKLLFCIHNKEWQIKRSSFM